MVVGQGSSPFVEVEREYLAVVGVLDAEQAASSEVAVVGLDDRGDVVQIEFA